MHKEYYYASGKFTMRGGNLLCEGKIYYARGFFDFARGKVSMNLCFARAAKGCLAFQAAMPRVTPAQNVATTRHESAALFQGSALE